MERRLGEESPFSVVDRARWPGPAFVRAGFYFNEDENAPISKDEIYLTISGAKVGC
jgi:hypothetical protein